MIKKRRIRIIDKDFARKLDFKDTKFPAKIRDTHKIEKTDSISISVFGKFPIYISKFFKDMLVYY